MPVQSSSAILKSRHHSKAVFAFRKQLQTALLLAAIAFAVRVHAQNRVGINTTTPLAGLHVADSSVLFSAVGDVPGIFTPPPVEGPGRRMMWYSQKAAFRTGYVNNVNWNQNNIGIFSSAFGYNTIASGISSFSAGQYSNAAGFYAVALGSSTTALGTGSFAMGINSTAKNSFAVAFGAETNASGQSSFAMGQQASASGDYSFAVGWHAVASNDDAVSLGVADSTSGSAALSTGQYTKASGQASSTFGSSTKAIGRYSTAFGVGTSSSATNCFTLGSYNETATDTPPSDILSGTDRIFQIGNGASVLSRSNALTVLRSGNTGIGVLNPEYTLDINGRVSLRNNGGNSAGIWYRNASNVATTFAGMKTDVQWGCYNNGWKFYFDFSNGEAYKTSGSTAWIVASDARLKENVHAYNDGLEQIMNIQPVWFNYTKESGFNTSKPYVGVLAQQLKETAPYMVGNFTKDGEELLNVDNSAMTYMLINAVKELKQQVETLKQQIAAGAAKK